MTSTQSRRVPLHKLVVAGTHPFIKRGGQTFARFDTISIVCTKDGEKNVATAHYIWRGVEVSKTVVEGYTANAPLTLRGFQGEIPVKDTRP